MSASLAMMLRVPTDEEVVDVLVEALRTAPAIPVPEQVAGGVDHAQGLQVGDVEVVLCRVGEAQKVTQTPQQARDARLDRWRRTWNG